MICASLLGGTLCPQIYRPLCVTRSIRGRWLVKYEGTTFKIEPSLEKLWFVRAIYCWEPSRGTRIGLASDTPGSPRPEKRGWFRQSMHLSSHMSRRTSLTQTGATAEASEGVEDSSGEEEAFELSQGWADPTPENILALALTAVVLLASLRIGWEILLVAFAVATVALKYSFVAVVLIIAVLFLL